MDAFGHLNHVIYAKYFENARVNFMSTNGLFPTESVKEGPVIVRLELDYRRQVRYPEVLEITLAVKSYSSRGFTMSCSMWSSEECVLTGYAEFLWFSFENGKPGRIPEKAIRAFESIKKE